VITTAATRNASTSPATFSARRTSRSYDRSADRQLCARTRFGQTATVVGLLLSVTFACGLFIAIAHVVNQRFIAPVYDVAANLTAFGCAVAASLLLGHPLPATFSAVAVVCWLVLARRTILDRRGDKS